MSTPTVTMPSSASEIACGRKMCSSTMYSGDQGVGASVGTGATDGVGVGVGLADSIAVA